MTTKTCARELEVVEAVLGRRWPDGCDEDLLRHTETCTACAEVLTVTSALQADAAGVRDGLTERGYPLPSAGQIWWRAAVRARADAAQAAARPLVWGYGIAAACTAGLLAAVTAYVWPTVVNRVEQIESVAVRVAPSADRTAGAIAELVRGQWPLVVVVAACLIAAPVAVYLALREE